MAMLSRGPPKDRPYDWESQLSEQQRRTLGDLGEDFPKLRRVRSPPARANASHGWADPTSHASRVARFYSQEIDLANDDISRVKKVQKYLRENHITGIQSQMRIASALKGEGVLTDRVWYTLHTLIAGQAIGKDLKDPFKPLQDPVNQK